MITPDKLNARKAINKAYLKVKPNRNQIENFKTNLIELLDGIKENESEEFHKNLASRFLLNTYYADRSFINTKERTDLVIYNGKDAQSSAGVIIEAKNPLNKYEMLTVGDFNRKAMHELVLYFLRERITRNNKEIKQLIATNIYEWFIFDATVFENLFAKNEQLVNDFKEFEAKRLTGTNTDYFYKDIAAPFIAQLRQTVSFTYIDLRQYEKPLRDKQKENDSKLIPLYKLFSPEHLLKLPFANDSNSLDRGFYNELLHIIGLEEIKEGSKKVIGRKVDGKRDAGSLLENTITVLQYDDCLSNVKRANYGSDKEEQLFNLALELVITWVNRILFLKLLEGQLISYHKGDKSYRFLNSQLIGDFDELNKLFFRVLALREDERSDEISKKYGHVPYLNSSLFEPSELEHKTIRISNLEDGTALPVLGSTILKNQHGKRIKGELNALHYLFRFLDAYDFASEGAEEIQEENKTLINASVLGLIFEKINGYKDGSFFTPGFITMYMCRETIRRAVVQKFNETWDWNCAGFDELKEDLVNEIRQNPKGRELVRREANDLVNSLRICDPAVGSGHFLVSALNELIAVKSELNILTDREGKPLNDYSIEIVNDELIVTDLDGNFFEYHPANKESQRMQETLFHEKQTLIENCLFGVDINPNSVKICRLRLWIELLKNAYYRKDGKLETLPNIDINIKCGNSLISRYALDADIKKAMKDQKWTMDSYRAAASSYRNAKNKEEKRMMEDLILKIKQNITSEIRRNDPLKKKYDKLSHELYNRFTGNFLFESEAEYGNKSKGLTRKAKKEQEKLEKEIDIISKKMDEIKNNEIFENPLEWRFEFPEILNDEGDFIGFDIVIGNPPYIRQEEFSEIKTHLQSHYKTYAGTADLYVYFVERGIQITKPGGQFIYILPNKWMRAGYGLAMRQWITSYSIQSIIDFGDLPVFEEATTYPCIWHIAKKASEANTFHAANITTLEMPQGLAKYISSAIFDVDQKFLPESGWTLVDDRVQKLIEKIKGQGVKLERYVNGKIYRGVLTGFNEAFVIDEVTKKRLIAEDAKSEEIIKPFLAGRDIKRYQQPKSDKYLIFTRRGINIEEYPAIKNYLTQFKSKLEPKPKNYSGKNWIGRKPGPYKWYEIQDSVAYYQEFEKDKIIYPNICKRPEFSIDLNRLYTNQKCFIIPNGSKYLLAILNSRITFFLFQNILPVLRGNFYEPSFIYFKDFPIIDKKGIFPLESKVDKILFQKSQNPSADTSALEAEIDLLVYKLYGLTWEEVRIVDPEFGMNEETYDQFTKEEESKSNN